MLILLVLHSYFEVKNVETNHSVMHQSHEALDLPLYLFEKFLILSCQLWCILAFRVETYILTDSFGLFFNILLQYISKEILDSDYWVIIHWHEVGS